MGRFDKADIARIAARVAGIDIADDWTGVDPVLPLIERMRRDGAVVVLKWDGERDPNAGELPVTAIVQAGPLGDDFVRTEAGIVDDALCEVIGEYAEHAWPETGNAAAFRVESILASQRMVFARAVDGAAPALRPGGTLAGCPVVHLDVPRKTLPDGSQDVSLVCFVLSDVPDAIVFATGAVVEYAHG